MIPSLQQLQQYNVNRPGAVEGIRSSLYDRIQYPAAGTTQLLFFQVPQGQAGKTAADTNMTAAGALPSPQSFLIETIEISFFSPTPPFVRGAGAVTNSQINDNYTFYRNGGWLELFIGSKVYLTEAPLMKFPPRNGLAGVAAFADTSTAGANQLAGVQYACAGGPVYQLDPPILLVPTQNFNVALKWPAAVPITVASEVMISMSGVLYRNSQ